MVQPLTKRTAVNYHFKARVNGSLLDKPLIINHLKFTLPSTIDSFAFLVLMRNCLLQKE